jgi:hypothetical protein
MYFGYIKFIGGSLRLSVDTRLKTLVDLALLVAAAALLLMLLAALAGLRPPATSP